MTRIYGEYYCINGCLPYPVNNKIIFDLIQWIEPSCIVEAADYYKISPNNLSYDGVMDGLYEADRRQGFLVTENFPYTLIDIDLKYINEPCRLMLEFFDSDYYGISLLFGSDVLTIDSLRDRLVIPFYQIVKPVYGNNGIEKALHSISQMNSVEREVFNSEFMLNKEMCEVVGIKYINMAIDVIQIKGVGKYFPQQSKKIYESIFRKILQRKNKHKNAHSTTLFSKE